MCVISLCVSLCVCCFFVCFCVCFCVFFSVCFCVCVLCICVFLCVCVCFFVQMFLEKSHQETPVEEKGYVFRQALFPRQQQMFPEWFEAESLTDCVCVCVCASHWLPFLQLPGPVACWVKQLCVCVGFCPPSPAHVHLHSNMT